jgi:tetratricopeptide (TPR) repeat protein
MVAMGRIGPVVILALLPSVAAAGQTAPSKGSTTRSVTARFAAQRLADWTTAVRAHAAGTVDQPLQTVASWPHEHVALVVQLVGAAAKAGDPDSAHTMLLGLSLHTDIAIAERDLGAPPGMGGAVTLVDGQVTRYLGRSAHWPIARRIAATLAPLAGKGPRVAAWYRATAALMQEWGATDLLGPHLEAGQSLFEDDPVLALYQGTLRQTFGDPRFYEYLRKRRSTEGLGRPPLASRNGPPRFAPARVPPVSAFELVIAKRELRRALTLDPALHEARIRLAHVLGALGDDREAAEVVRPALEAPLSPFFEYYAAVILGRSEEQLGRFDEAGIAYARAAARFPGAEAAEIGRSRVALAQGRAADGLKILVDAVGPFCTEQLDPWLDYLKQHDPDAETLLKAWRESLK